MNALLSAFAFGQPWILLGLLSLPVIWWLLRATPPAPQRISFPPARLIFEMARREETPARTPWWLLLLRLLIAALIVAGLARPVLNPGAEFASSGPVVLIVDDGWAAAQSWRARVQTMVDIANRARRQERPVILLRTTPDPDAVAPRAAFMSATEAQGIIQGMEPRSWRPDHAAAAAALEGLSLEGAANLYWLSNGLEGADARALIEAARRIGTLTVIERPAGESVTLVRSVEGAGAQVEVRLERDIDTTAETAMVRMAAEDGRILMRRPVAFEPGMRQTSLTETLPVEALNQIARVEIEGRQSAGSLALLGDGLKRYRAGLAGTREPERAQPLLSDLYYLERALAPFAEIREGEIARLLDEPLSMLVLADVGQLVELDRLRVADWIEKGGVLVRFAGPRLAEQSDDLLPVAIRQGGRNLQGAMSWSEPAKLAPFPESSPFRGLPVPNDVSVRRQVLAEPTVDLPEKTWARLEDGTPLVTAEARGKGWLILVHTSANTAWSNLSLSGLFVEMLRRMSALSTGIDVEAEDRMLAPQTVLDGFGRSARPGPTVRPLNQAAVAETPIGPRHPPGLYGEDAAALAFNVGDRAAQPVRLGDLPAGVLRGEIGGDPERDLGPWLLALALALLLADFVIALWLRGHHRFSRRSATASALLCAALTAGLVLAPATGHAQQAGEVDRSVVEDALDMRLAYVVTGDDRVDRMSAAGMFGLNEILRARTSVEPVEAAALDIERDELIFYPVVYWPMTESQPALSDRAVQKLDSYLRTGGLVLFDTRDDGSPIGRGSDAGPGTMRLRQLLSRIDVGPLKSVDEDHVLGRSFYLMDVFPGRYSGGRVWVENLDSSANDGVSPLVIGGADWAAAWAMDDSGRPVAMLHGGGDQREMSFRFGVNLVMYALTGNYKADQVHLPAILERLGQ
ncbi:DUF4159 domain-containing protein [Minwuia thermotolerans]|uniref:DUF4159 domain-containing protein n=1 Tax=Minwuia thermotolerans TaxID=2056226 RepID=UPI0019D003B3|nr:DUF4159 domain-containing protein [Minwuia thermotolerans]